MRVTMTKCEVCREPCRLVDLSEPDPDDGWRRCPECEYPVALDIARLTAPERLATEAGS